MEDKILQFPQQTPDAQEMMLDGKPEMMLSARGVALMCLPAWKLDGNEKAHCVLRRYCEYITMHGYKGGANTALAELDRVDIARGKAWIRRTFAQYVKKENQIALVAYMLGQR